MKIQPGLLQRISDEIDPNYSSICLISDENAGSLYPICPDALTILIPSGEKSKSLETAAMIWTKMIEHGCDRNTLVIGLGGGVITDLAGFVSSCYMRGVNLCLIPTTLLAMVDAAIGGKTAVNLAEGKNLIGSFHPAAYTLIDPSVLATLPDRHFNSGLAEVIKTAVILDEEFFQYLEEHMDEILRRKEPYLTEIIRRTAELKQSIVQIDPKDQGRRACLNFGHTFAHAIETATNYQSYEHGEAVAIGMRLAARLSHRMGLIPEDLIRRLESLIKRAELPLEIPEIDPEQFLLLMKRDKKNIRGTIICILIDQLGNAFPEPIAEELILETIASTKSCLL